MKVFYPGTEPTLHPRAGLLTPGVNDVDDSRDPQALIDSGFCAAAPHASAAEHAPEPSPASVESPRRRRTFEQPAIEPIETREE